MTVFGRNQGGSSIMHKDFNWKRSRISVLEVEAVPQRLIVACPLFGEHISRRVYHAVVTTKLKTECSKDVEGTSQPDAGALNLECAPSYPGSAVRPTRWRPGELVTNRN
jgi:hypothetical protein